VHPSPPLNHWLKSNDSTRGQFLSQDDGQLEIVTFKAVRNRKIGQAAVRAEICSGIAGSCTH
jgi:hypothetical protein